MAMAAVLRNVPAKALTYLIYSAQELSAQEAVTFGLASRVLPQATFERDTEAFLTELAGRKDAPARARAALRADPRMADLAWKDALDAFTCTECGRCKDACPTFLTGKPLSMKWVNDSLKQHLLTQREALLAPGPAPAQAEDSLPTLVGPVVSEEALWACTTCGYCEAACPIELEHLPTFEVDVVRRWPSVEKAERLSGYKISSAFVAVGGSHISSQNSRGVVAVSGHKREVSREDVGRATEAAKAVQVPSNREILHERIPGLGPSNWTARAPTSLRHMTASSAASSSG